MEVIETLDFHDATALAWFITAALEPGKVIYLQTPDGNVLNRATLVEETLSDGSTVRNIILRSEP